MSKWNFADVWEAVADTLPDAPALTHGDRTLTWAEFDHRADGLARWLLGAGVDRQDKVALYLYNCSEYLEATFACFKLALVPINTNYRYADDELVYLWDNADAVAVVFHGTFVDRIDRIRSDLPRIRSGCGSTTARDRARPGPPPTRRSPRRPGRRRSKGWGRMARSTARRRAGGRSLGPDRRRPLHALHRRDHRDAQGRHVAPGRPLRPAERLGLPPLPRGRRAGRRPRRAGTERPRDDPAAGLSPDARHRRVHRHRVPERGRSGESP